MKERGIVFGAPMVRAILDGRKTQTRWIVKTPPNMTRAFPDPGGTIFGPGPYLKVFRPVEDDEIMERVRCPFGCVGDRLWVRETWAAAFDHECWGTVFKAGGYEQGRRKHERGPYYNANDLPPVKWRSPIHMPRWASRITLEISGVGLERVQCISEEDARWEGIGLVMADTEPGLTDAIRKSRRTGFAFMWDRIHGAGVWARNDWVWALTFRRV